MNQTFYHKPFRSPFVMNWGFLENWKSTAPLS